MEAVELLCSRGANTNARYTPPQYESNLSGRSILIASLGLFNAELAKNIGRILVHHGADVNEVGFPCYDDGQSAGYFYRERELPTTYFPKVVMSGDVAWAEKRVTEPFLQQAFTKRGFASVDEGP